MNSDLKNLGLNESFRLGSSLIYRLVGKKRSVDVDGKSLTLNIGSSVRLIPIDDFDSFPLFTSGVFSDTVCLVINGDREKISGLSRRSRKEKRHRLSEIYARHTIDRIQKCRGQLSVNAARGFQNMKSVEELHHLIERFVSVYTASQKQFEEFMSYDQKKAAEDLIRVSPLREKLANARHTIDRIQKCRGQLSVNVAEGFQNMKSVEELHHLIERFVSVYTASQKQFEEFMSYDQKKAAEDLIRVSPLRENLAKVVAVVSLAADFRKQTEILAVERFMRDSDVPVLQQNFNKFFAAFGETDGVRSLLIQEGKLQGIIKLVRLNPLSRSKKRLRRLYEEKMLNEQKSFFESVESNPLTIEQRLAVIRNNDLNLVLAAAGTGKTSVIVAKVLYLICFAEVSPEQILVLAYNKKAVAELDERIRLRTEQLRLTNPDLLPDAEISVATKTFHALGREILGSLGKKTDVSKLATDKLLRRSWFEARLEEIAVHDLDSLLEFSGLLCAADDPFDFESEADYQAYIRDNEFRTLNGDKVKSHGEVLIGNALYAWGIEHEYEAQYVTGSEEKLEFDYCPDFHISDTRIYIEHFGVDGNGNTASWIDAQKYRSEMESKIETHARFDSILIKTTHQDKVDGILRKRLREQLEDYSVQFHPRPVGKLYEKLNQLGKATKFAKLMTSVIEVMKSQSLRMEDVQSRLDQSGYNQTRFLMPLLSHLYLEYESYLHEAGQIDFNDMIHLAAEKVRTGSYVSKWKYILVDEFQDISQSRFDLIRALLDSVDEPVLYSVGDDWQSIYRFAGGKLELTTRFEELIGAHSSTTLQKTFRYNRSIADTAGRFIMNNPEQCRKEVTTHSRRQGAQIHLIADSAPQGSDNSDSETSINDVISNIRSSDSKASIIVLARYNKLLDTTRKSVTRAKLSTNVEFLTFHRSKGLEADYCILLGMNGGRWGFPNERRDDEILEALLPSLDDFPHSEERRLMYVGLTRACMKVYILSDPLSPSEFVEELCHDDYDLVEKAEAFDLETRKTFKCPNCRDGYLVEKMGYRVYFACNTFPGCSTIVQPCKKCGSPSVDAGTQRTCRNPECGEVLELCPDCGRPLILRNGKYGAFYGCSGYGIPGSEGCSYTRNTG